MTTKTRLPLLFLFLPALPAFAGDGSDSALLTIQREVLASAYEQAAWEDRLRDAEIRLGAWSRVGPFRSQAPGLNWADDRDASFAHVYAVETDLLHQGAPIFEKKYLADAFPATPEASRRWVSQPEWVDGYLCDLPRGPAPSAGESQYVHRVIQAGKPISVLLDFRVRAPEESWDPTWPERFKGVKNTAREKGQYRARYKCWLNGKLLTVWDGEVDAPPPVELPLKAGANHFFAKVTNNRHCYGFSFAIRGLHPKPELSAVDGKPSSWFSAYPPSEKPWFREGDRGKPANHDRAQRYRDVLTRLAELRFSMSPMPGIENGARDEQGEIVTVMEKGLGAYPVSEQGKRYRSRLRKLEEKVTALLERLVSEDRPLYQEVVTVGELLDEHWAKTIRELPEILFLERPRYGHSANMFTNDGKAPSFIRAFDPAERKVRTLFHDPSLTAHEINLSWDAKTVSIGGGGSIWRVGIDGSGFQRIASGQSPAELPDGRIVFFDDAPGCSPCKGGRPRRLLFTVDPDGNLRKVVSANLTIDNHPQVMNNGQVVFSRWDYGVNKDVFNRHGIWLQNPDGSAMDLYFGNTIIDPFAFYRARQIPNRPEFVCVMGAHHALNSGLIGLVWNGFGREAADGAGFQRITHDTASIADNPALFMFQDPYPLNETLFLVSYAGDARHKTGIYLLDRYGNRKCLFEPERNLAAVCPQPLQARTRPPIIPDLTTNPEWTEPDLQQRLLTDPDWSAKGTLWLQDIYQGVEPEIPRGRIKYLAVMEQVPENVGRGGAMGLGNYFYVNRLIGLVPIEEDGSAHFEVPALRSLYFHALDKDGKMLMTQGSDFHLMPGEQRGCIGCHEQRKGIHSPPNTGSYSLATAKLPVRPELPRWGTRGIIEYESVVQPVFDKHCVSCHSGPRPDGLLNLSADRTTVFNLSYLELTEKEFVHFTHGNGRTFAQLNLDYDEQAPLSRGSVLSKLTRVLDDPEHRDGDSRLTWEEKLRVFLWIDSNIPFYGHYEQHSPTILSGFAIKTLKAIYHKRCAACHNQPGQPDTPDFLHPWSIQVHVGKNSPGQWNLAKSGMRVRHLNLSNPADSAAVLAPLSKESGGWGLCKLPAGKAVFPSADDPDRKKLLETLTSGVVRRDQPGVVELIENQHGKPHYQLITR